MLIDSYTVNVFCMSDNSRGQESGRQGNLGYQSPENGTGRHQAREGFEGMNYEQRRAPYKGGRETASDRRDDSSGMSGSGNRRDDL